MKKKLIILVTSLVLMFVITVGVIAFNYPENKSEWTLSRLIEESDCCVMISTSYLGFCYRAIPSEPLKEVYEKDGKIYQEVVVSYAGQHKKVFKKMGKYSEPPTYEIVIIQENEKILTGDDYLLFLTKAEEEGCFYILGGKDGVVEIDDNGRFKPLNRCLKRELYDFFKDIIGFSDWIENDYEFSENMYQKKTVTHSSVETTTAP
ncbi:MAG: hypothetical protein IKT89_04115 [Clostridia bacterium]|nr:hypothetical protein [Clostridia bacterium]